MTSGEAAAAFLVRAPTVEQVEAFARAGETHAAEEHVLLPQADERAALLPVRRVTTDWLQVCRDAAVAVAGVLEELPTRLEREPRVGDGEGGDETTAIDAAAEEAVVRRLEEVERTGFTLVSEELGERVFGDGGDGLRIVVRPDRREHERQARHPVLLALARGRRRARRWTTSSFGFVHDFGTGEEWVARKGEGAFLNGEPLTGPGPKERIEIL